jgi:hypothetical protein
VFARACLCAQVDEVSGAPKVVAPELIVAYIQAKYAGDADAPKGGLLLLGHGSPSRAPQTANKLCGDPATWKTSRVTYKDEPYSMQAYDKAIYGIRDTYRRLLSGTLEENPADDALVTGFHSNLRRLLGYKPQHVPKVRAPPHPGVWVWGSTRRALLFLSRRTTGSRSASCVRQRTGLCFAAAHNRTGRCGASLNGYASRA